MEYELRYTEKFLEHAPTIGGTDLGRAVLALARRVATAPGQVGSPGMLLGVRFAPVGHGVWHLAWIVCEECFALPIEDRIAEPCCLCEGPREVILTDLYRTF
jgi:hypothetical protein